MVKEERSLRTRLAAGSKRRHCAAHSDNFGSRPVTPDEASNAGVAALVHDHAWTRIRIRQHQRRWNASIPMRPTPCTFADAFLRSYALSRCCRREVVRPCPPHS